MEMGSDGSKGRRRTVILNMKRTEKDSKFLDQRTVPDHKWDEVMAQFGRLFDHPEELDRYEDGARILILDEEQVPGLLTKERIRILRLVRKGRVGSLSELAEALGRDPSAVNRDIDVLERSGIVSRIRNGRGMRPVLAFDVILLPFLDVDLLEVLKGLPSKGPGPSVPDDIDTILLMGRMLKGIYRRLDRTSPLRKDAKGLIARWLRQELEEIPGRLISRFIGLSDYTEGLLSKGKGGKARTRPSG